MKTFFILLIVFGVALTGAIPAPAEPAAASSITSMSSRRLKIPAAIKKVLKGAAQFFVGMLIDCLFSYAQAKLPNIPFLKNLMKSAVNMKDKLKAKVQEMVGKVIDKLRRIRRLRVRRAGIFGKIKKGINKVAKKAKKAANKELKKAAKNAKKTLKKVGKVMKKAVKVIAKGAAGLQKLAKALDKLTGGALQKALIKLACPIVVKGVCQGISYGLKAVGFTLGLPPCIEENLAKGCVKLVKLAFKRHRLLRRLGYVTGDFKVLY